MPAIPMSNYLLQVLPRWQGFVRLSNLSSSRVIMCGSINAPAASSMSKSVLAWSLRKPDRLFSSMTMTRYLHIERGVQLQPSFYFQEIHFPIQTKFRSMHISSVEGVHDMILLGDLKESAILHNLHVRYKEDEIYVRRLFSSN